SSSPSSARATSATTVGSASVFGSAHKSYEHTAAASTSPANWARAPLSQWCSPRTSINHQEMRGNSHTPSHRRSYRDSGLSSGQIVKPELGGRARIFGVSPETAAATASVTLG